MRIATSAGAGLRSSPRTDDSWDQAGGFIAEFCSLGGSVVRESPRLGTTDISPVVARLSDERLDGMYLASNSGWLVTLAKELPQLQGPLTTSSSRASSRCRTRSVQHAWQAPRRRRVGPRRGEHGTEHPPGIATGTLRCAFPALPPGSGLYNVPIAYYDAMDAVVQALEKVDGDLSDGQRRFQAALAKVSLDAPNGKTRLDANRQAIGPNYLARVERDAKGNLASCRSGRSRTSTRASAGSSPGPTHRMGPPLRRARSGSPPPWAR